MKTLFYPVQQRAISMYTCVELVFCTTDKHSTDVLNLFISYKSMYIVYPSSLV